MKSTKYHAGDSDDSIACNNKLCKESKHGNPKMHKGHQKRKTDGSRFLKFAWSYVLDQSKVFALLELSTIKQKQKNISNKLYYIMLSLCLPFLGFQNAL